jgi:DNA-binding CsgD family transcriptional regulator
VAVWCLDGGAGDEATGVLVAAAHQALALSEWALAERLSRAALPGDPVRATLTLAVALPPQARLREVIPLLDGLSPAALAGDLGPELRGEAVRVAAWALLLRKGADSTLDDLLSGAVEVPATLRPAVLVHCAFQAVLWARPAVALSLLAASRTAAEGAGGAGAGAGPEVEAQAAAVLAFALVTQGRVGEALATAEAALPAATAQLAADPIPANPVGALPPGYCLALALDGRVGDAGAVAGMVLAGVQDGGPPALRALAAALAGRIDLLAGRLADARHHCEEALAACVATGQLPASHWPATVLASAAAQLGDLPAAEEALRAAQRAGPVLPLYALEEGLARAWAHAARGESSAARAAALRTADEAAAAGVVAFELLALLDLARLGDPRIAAARLTAPAPAPGGAAGEDVPGKGALRDVVAGYARALAAGDGAGLDRASQRFEDAGALLLAAEAAAGAAAAHRADGLRASAAAALGRARVLAAGCDGPRTPALRDLGTEPAVASLTDREREVAELASHGLTNREIATRLYVSVRTVNTHLHRAYAKLGVSDRDRLAPLLRVVRRD